MHSAQLSYNELLFSIILIKKKKQKSTGRQSSRKRYNLLGAKETFLPKKYYMHMQYKHGNGGKNLINSCSRHDTGKI